MTRCCLPVQEQSANVQQDVPPATPRDSASAKAAVTKAVMSDPDMETERQLAAMVCSLENKDACLMCGS